MGKFNKALISSESDEWATPQDLFDELDAEFNFNLDPCATEQNAKCEKFYTLQDNGLSHSWGGGTESSAIPHIVRCQSG